MLGCFFSAVNLNNGKSSYKIKYERRKIMDYIERMEQELKELTEKGMKLDKAIRELEGLSAEESGLMYAQLYSMNSYADILSRRIELAKKLGKDN